jgi:hypothetical protein
MGPRLRIEGAAEPDVAKLGEAAGVEFEEDGPEPVLVWNGRLGDLPGGSGGQGSLPEGARRGGEVD